MSGTIEVSETRAPTPYTSAFVRHVRAAILADAQPELELALRVGALQAAGFPRAVIAAKLQVTPTQLRAAEQRLRRAMGRLEAG